MATIPRKTETHRRRAPAFLSALASLPRKTLNYLKTLEAESIQIFREAAAEFARR